MELETSSVSDLSDKQLQFLHKHNISGDRLQIALAIDKEARKQGINPEFVFPMVMQESKFSQDTVSPKGAIGVMQLMEETAKGLKVDPNDLQQNIRGGISLLKELVSNEKIGSDPYKVLAGYNASTETRNKFYESGSLADLPDETIKHMHAIGKFYGGDLPSALFSAPEAEEPKVEKKVDVASKPITDEEKSATHIPKAIASYIGAGAGATAGAGIGAGAAGLHMKTDVAKILASYPEAISALKSGKSPAEVLDMVLKGKASTGELPVAQGPLQGEPAGGYQTQNWVKSGDTQGRYTDVGLNARDKAEAHQMKLQAMAAEDKIRRIAPEMRPDPNRANLFVPESAGRGPSPRFGGAPNVPIPPVPTPVAEAPSMLGTVANYAKGYLPYLKYPALGALTGANVAHGVADVYNRVVDKQPAEAALSAMGTTASTIAPFVGGVASGPLSVAGGAVPLYLAASDRLRHLKKHPEDYVLENTDVDPMGNRIR